MTEKGGRDLKKTYRTLQVDSLLVDGREERRALALVSFL